MALNSFSNSVCLILSLPDIFPLSWKGACHPCAAGYANLKARRLRFYHTSYIITTMLFPNSCRWCEYPTIGWCRQLWCPIWQKSLTGRRYSKGPTSSAYYQAHCAGRIRRYLDADSTSRQLSAMSRVWLHLNDVMTAYNLWPPLGSANRLLLSQPMVRTKTERKMLSHRNSVHLERFATDRTSVLQCPAVQSEP